MNYFQGDLPELKEVTIRFIRELKNALGSKPIFMISDQENSLMRKEASGKRLADGIPHRLRNDIGTYQILSASSNNEDRWTTAEPRVFNLFIRMTGIFSPT